MSENNTAATIPANGNAVATDEKTGIGFWGWAGVTAGATALVGAGYLGARLLAPKASEAAAPMASEAAAAAMRYFIRAA